MGKLHPLARLRGRRGWTGRDLARAADIADETVSRIENGYQPSPRTIYKLALALEMDFDDLVSLLVEEPEDVSA